MECMKEEAASAGDAARGVVRNGTSRYTGLLLRASHFRWDP